MKPTVSLILIALAGVLLAGCSTNAIEKPSRDVTFNPANYQGCTSVPYYVEKGENGESGRSGMFIDCKDKAALKVSLDLNSDGNPDMTYDASDVVGSDAAAVRASVEKAFAQAGVDVSSDVIEAVVSALSPPGD